MKMSARKINAFMILKLPLAYIAGVRVKLIADIESSVYIKYKWINQNPFRSIFWAAQGMAAELSTGVLVMKEINNSNQKISMLVTSQQAVFTKKARGKIRFSCKNGELVKEAIQKTVKTGEGQNVVMISEGIDEKGESVSKFQFEWSIKLKSNNN